MYRKQKTISAGNTEFTVYEMKIKDIIRLQNDEPHILFGMVIGDPDAILHALKLCVEPADKLNEIEYVNAFALLEQTWREVNSDFLQILPQRVEIFKKVADVLGVSLTGGTSSLNKDIR